MSCLDAFAEELVAWHWWRGVGGLFYARRVKSSPPIVFQAESLDELRELVRQHIAARQP
jgi:hypothetical protein